MNQAKREADAVELRSRINVKLAKRVQTDKTWLRRNRITLAMAVGVIAVEVLREAIYERMGFDVATLRIIGIEIPKHVPDDHVVRDEDIIGTARVGGEMHIMWAWSE